MKQEDIDKAFENRWRMKHYILENINGAYAKEIARDFFETGILIAEQSTVPAASPAGTTITARAERFHLQVFSFTGQYPDTLLNDFYEYWSEPNPSQTKMRFEQQRTWDLPRRLARWARNDFNHYGNKQSPSSQQQKLADILVG